MSLLFFFLGGAAAADSTDVDGGRDYRGSYHEQRPLHAEEKKKVKKIRKRIKRVLRKKAPQQTDFEPIVELLEQERELTLRAIDELLPDLMARVQMLAILDEAAREQEKQREALLQMGEALELARIGREERERELQEMWVQAVFDQERKTAQHLTRVMQDEELLTILLGNTH